MKSKEFHLKVIREGIVFGSIVGALAIAAQIMSLHFARTTDIAWVEPPREAPGKWNPSLFKAFALGQAPSAVDWMVLRFLTDPAYAHITEGQHPPAFYDLDLATDLDPAFYDLYVQGASFLAVIRNDIEGSLTLLQKGESFRKTELSLYSEDFKKRHWPSTWALPFTLGYVQLFEKKNLPAAAEAFQEAASYTDSPAFLKGLAARFKNPEQFLDGAIRILEIMILGTKDEKAQSVLLLHRRDLGILKLLQDLTADFHRFLKANPGTPISRGWDIYRSVRGVSKDPYGGDLSVSESGKVRTSTPIRHTLGIKTE